MGAQYSTEYRMIGLVQRSWLNDSGPGHYIERLAE